MSIRIDLTNIMRLLGEALFAKYDRDKDQLLSQIEARLFQLVEPWNREHLHALVTGHSLCQARTLCECRQGASDSR